jgi:chromosomal replication initiation ATPase DnaA
MSEGNVWNEILERLKADLDPEEYRRWFLASSYASDSGDIVSVWVPSIADGRHIQLNYGDLLQRALISLGRQHTSLRFIATGYTGEEDEDEDENA